MTHPYLTSSIQAIGGTIKDSPDDFNVEEIPSYQPCGSGEHLYLTIEKRGMTTLEAIRRIAAGLKVSEREIGYAGLKDAVGVTRQTMSLQRVSAEAARALDLEGITIVAAERHTNKLKPGHLKGNRFRIAVRGVTAESAAQSVPAVLEILVKRGVPNYFGYQRYGAQGNSHLIGAALLRRDWQGAVDFLIGDPDAVRDREWTAAIHAYRQGDVASSVPDLSASLPQRTRCAATAGSPSWSVSRKRFRAVHPRLKKLYLSALQSFLFDQAVAARIDGIDEVKCGDLACKHVNGACFLVADAELEKGRATALEISASGPMFGCRMKQPEGQVRELEFELLRQAGLTLDDFDLPGGLRMEGERRPLRVPLGEVSYTLEGDCLRLEFTLPRGSYATSVLREIMKTF